LRDKNDSIITWRESFSYFTDYYKISEEPAAADIARALDWLGFINLPLAKKGTANERRVYNLLDLLSEMGGFLSSILSISVFVVGFYNAMRYKINAVTTSFQISMV
jgi:hypothetical protein